MNSSNEINVEIVGMDSPRGEDWASDAAAAAEDEGEAKRKSTVHTSGTRSDRERYRTSCRKDKHRDQHD